MLFSAPNTHSPIPGIVVLMALNWSSWELWWVLYFLNAAQKHPMEEEAQYRNEQRKFGGNFPRETSSHPPTLWINSVISLFWSLSTLSVGEDLLMSKPICLKQLLFRHRSLPRLLARRHISVPFVGWPLWAGLWRSKEEYEKILASQSLQH